MSEGGIQGREQAGASLLAASNNSTQVAEPWLANLTWSHRFITSALHSPMLDVDPIDSIEFGTHHLGLHRRYGSTSDHDRSQGGGVSSLQSSATSTPALDASPGDEGIRSRLAKVMCSYWSFR